MYAFAVNTQYVDISTLIQSSYLKTGTDAYFSIESELNELELKKGSHLLLVKPIESDLLFTNTGVITHVGHVTTVKQLSNKNSKNVKDKYLHRFNFKVEKELIKNNSLNDLLYSLQIIYNYNKPASHFYQQYRGLDKNDFDTIANGYIYAVRTVFGKIVNAIPRQNKLEFMLKAIDRFSTIDFSKVNLFDGLVFLNEYVDERILSRGRILVATNNLINKKLNDLIPSNEIGFIDPDNLKENNLNYQANIFEKLFKIEKQQNTLKLLKDIIEDNPDLEQHFQKVFNKTTWPIDLKV